ncbi:MAG: hypothetical protein M1838_003132 [Thelocarpon superellum]|nr:MAG: hypothetical protein M1838_003132 [Thelocarpon superellum]
MESHPDINNNNDPVPFPYPQTHSFPPFYTLQPNTSTLHAQLTTWSSLILSYCRHHRLFKLSLSDALEWDLFCNKTIQRRLSLNDARAVIDFMRTKEGRAEWADAGKGGKGEGNVCWIWWRRAEEWAELLEHWVDETGQKNTVLTFYELTDGEMSRGTEFHGMDREVLQKSLNVLTKRGKAQVFGNEDQPGVKFF